MKKKVIIAIGGSIALVSVAATFIAFQLSKDSEIKKPIDVSPVENLLNKAKPKPVVKKVEPEKAYAIYRYEQEFVYIDDIGSPPKKIWVAGDEGVVEANFVEKTNVTDKVCDEEVDRPLAKYAMINDFGMKPYIALERSDVKFDLITEDFAEQEFPLELVGWAKETFEPTRRIPEEKEGFEPFEAKNLCKYKTIGEDLEKVICEDQELLLLSRQPIGNLNNSGPSYEPVAFLTIGDKKFLLVKYNENNESKLSIQDGLEPKKFSVQEVHYPTYCEPNEGYGC